MRTTFVAIALALFVTNSGWSQDHGSNSRPTGEVNTEQRIESWKLPELVTAVIEDQRIVFSVAPKVSEFSIPNLYAPIRSLRWLGESKKGSQSAEKLEIEPLTDSWVIRFAASESSRQIVLQLDAPISSFSEVRSTVAAGDGSILIPAHNATTFGDKLRYEPQPWKNTVGYWTGVDDFAVFPVEFDRSGSFNVGLLQGCGKDQGGSTAMISLYSDAEPAKSMRLALERMNEKSLVDQFEFSANETGHFQNFQWRQAGVLKVPSAGSYLLKVSAVKIANAAVVDIRSIHLNPLP